MMPQEDSGMDDSLYGDGADAETPEAKESVDEKNAENPTALLPASSFGVKVKPGDTGTWKVVKDHGEEVEVSLSTDAEEEATEPSADDEFDAMAKE